MSYGMTLRSRQIALGYASLGDSKECSEAGEQFTKVAQYLGLTSDAVSKTVSQCCEVGKKASGDRSRLVYECLLRASATAGAAAACVAGGFTAPFAGVCGTVGAFMADRIAGYNKTQLSAGVAAGILCGVVTGGTTSGACFFAAAEVVGWVGDTLDKAIEGIFDPGAAARREVAKRAADNAALSDSQDKVLKVQDVIIGQWKDSVNRLWDLFETAFSPAYRTLAASKLGFGNNYQSIALALRGAGVPTYVMNSAELVKHKAETYPACEIYGRQVGGKWGQPSPVCPPFVDTMYKPYEGGGGSHESAERAKQMAADIMKASDLFFAMLPQAEAMLASKITVTAIAVKQQEALDQAAAYTRSQFATKAASAAASATAAADAALHGDAKESKAAVARAKNRYDMAVAAYNMLFDSMGSHKTAAETAAVTALCAKDPSCQKASDAVARAKAASELAVQNAAKATTKRYVIGAGITAAVAGGIYYFLIK